MKRREKDKRSIHFISLGCPKNRVDSEIMAGAVLRDGMEIVAHPEDADVIVVNTCAFIGDAKEESIGVLLEMARHRNSGKCSMLIAAGCLPQRSGVELAEAMPEIDKLMGTTSPDLITDVIAGATARVRMSVAGAFLPNVDTPRFVEPGSPFAYVKIADGCNRKCAFCAIPAIRGKAHSRPIEDIVSEARKLVERGVVELDLVAQDTSAYGVDLDDGATLTRLVEALDTVDGLRWVRVLYQYPDAVTDDFLHAMTRLRTLVPYLEVPIQHSSANMLKRMRRGHGPAALRKLLERARRIVPDIFIRTTVLVGHPGETKADVDDLVAFIGVAEFDHLGVFRYSDEEGTHSFGGVPAVSPRDSYNRWRKVMAAQRRVVMRHNQKLIGRRVEVLVEGVADLAGFVLVGRHGGQAPEIDGVTYLVSSTAKRGEIVSARVIETRVHDLVAEPL